MAELLTEHWWHISLALAVAIITAVVHRVCANIAFETSYKKGFFTQGAIFGAFLGFPGVMFVGTWRQIAAPNLSNLHQLEMAPEDGEERWDSSLFLITAGIGVLVYQLMSLVLRDQAIGSVWFWAAACVLGLLGWYTFRGSVPRYNTMPPVVVEGSDDPPELIQFLEKRYEWGQYVASAEVASKLKVLSLWMAIAFTITAFAVWGFKLPFASWIACVASILLCAGSIVAYFMLKTRYEDLEYDIQQLILSAAPTPRHRQLMKLQMDFHEHVESLNYPAVEAQRYAGPPIPLGLGQLGLGMSMDSELLIVTGTITFLISLVLMARGAMGPVHDEESLDEFVGEMQRMQAKIDGKAQEISKLAEELEEEDIAAALERAREDIPEFYSFQLGELTGQGMMVSEGLRQRIMRRQMDDELREEFDRDHAERAEGYLLWASIEAEYLSRLRTGRVRAFWAGIILLIFFLILAINEYSAMVLSALNYTALACFTLSLASFLPEKFHALRDPGCLGGIGKVASVALVIILIWALFNSPA